MAWLVEAVRRLRHDGIAVAGLAAIVFVTAGVFAAAPRLVDGAATRILRDQVAAVPVDVRSIQVTEEQRIPGADVEALGAVEAEGAALESRFPRGVLAITGDPVVVIDTPRWSVLSPVAAPATLRFRVQPGSDAHVRVVTGRMPGSSLREIAVPGDVDLPDVQTVPVVEGILPEAAARTLGIAAGDVVVTGLDRSDRLAAQSGGAIGLALVGTFVPLDPADEWWFGDASAARSVTRTVGNNYSFEDATALVAPAGYAALYGALATGGVPFRYTWRFRVDPGRMDAGNLSTTITALRRLETGFPAVPVVQGAQPLPALRGGLRPALERHAQRWSAASAVIAVVALGPGVVALLAVAMVVFIVARRRRFAAGLVASRGASRLQVAASLAFEGLLVGVPAALAGAGLVTLAIPGGDAALGVEAAVTAALATIVSVLLVAASVPAGGIPRGAPVGARAPDDAPRGGAAPRRLALEGLLIALALGGAALLLTRGGVGVPGASATTAAGAGTGGGLGTGAAPGTIDLFVLAVPAMLGIAGGLVAMRLFPLVMALFARLATLRRDLVPALALRRLTRDGGSGGVLAVLLATAAVGSFASAALVHLDSAAAAAGWQEVGAPFVAAATPSDATGTRAGTAVALPAGFDAATLPGVEKAAAAYRASVPLFPQGSRVEMLAVDAPAYAAVTAGLPPAAEIPPDLLRSTAGESIPAVVSSELPIGPRAPRVGDRFQATLFSEPRRFEVVAVRATFPSIEPGAAFLAVPLAAVRASVGEPIAPTEAFLLAPDSAEQSLRDAVSAAGPGIRIVARAAVSDGLAASPYVGVVRSGVAIAVLVAALYAVLAVAAALGLSGAARADEVGRLRTLGLSRRGVLTLAAVEHGPTVVASFAFGAVLGIAIFVVLRPALGLAELIDSAVEVPLRIDAPVLGLILAGMIAVTAVGVAIAAALQGRAALALAVRSRAE